MTQLEQVVLGAYASHVQVAGLVSQRYNFTDEPDTYNITTPDFDYIGYAYAIAVQSDGKVLVAGDSGLYDGEYYSVVKRFNTDGTLDTTFQSAWFDNYIYSIGIQSTGKIIVAGEFDVVDGNGAHSLVRLNSDGTFDESFNYGEYLNSPVYTVAIDLDDSIYAGGEFVDFDGTSCPQITKLDGEGNLDTGFAANSASLNLDGYVYDIVLNSDGTMYVAGWFDGSIKRLNVDCTVDATFNPGSGFNSYVNAIAVQDDGKILCGGNISNYDSSNFYYGLCRLNTDGSLDTTFELPGDFNGDWYPGVEAIAIQSTGKIVVGGWFVSLGGKLCNRIVRLNSDGSRDGSFGAYYGANDGVTEIVVGASDNLFVAGYFTQYAGNVLSNDFNFGNTQISFGFMKTNNNGSIIGQPLRYQFYRAGINDGNYVWDGGLYFNTNLTQSYDDIVDVGLDYENCIPHTHSNVMENGYSGVNYEYYELASDTYNYVSMPSDGRIKSGNHLFGNGSRYFTNMFPGLYVLAANNISIYEFNIYGNTEQDGDGYCNTGSFELTVNGYTFSAFYKSSYDAYDPTLNHLIIVDGGLDGLTQNVPDPIDASGEGDAHIIQGLDTRKELYVLVFAKANYAEVTETYMKLMANAFVSSFASPEVIKTCSNKGCGTAKGKVCKIGANSCTCAKIKFFNTQCSRIQQALGICSALNGAYVPAITVCNQRLF